MAKSGSVLLAAAVFCSAVLAQKPAVTGTITGHVTCADTNTPARLATVVLRPVPAVKSDDPAALDKPVEANRVQTQLDGSFSIPRVAPGTYLIIASLPGYVSPLADLGATNDDLLEPTAEMRKRLLDRIPTITLDGSGSASINVSLERAAAVSGTILYDDGSPASGIRVQMLQRIQGKWVPVQNAVGDDMGSGNSVTDDRGAFRITGLPSVKEAIVEATLSLQNYTLTFRKSGFGSSGGQPVSIAFYSGGITRQNDAAPFRLTIGEERSGEDMTLPISRLHKLKGALLAKKDGHVLNSGYLDLLFADDRSPLANARVEPDDENFEFSFVPEGDYLLRVLSAADAHLEEISNPPGTFPPTTTNASVTHQYGFAEVWLHVDGDSRVNVSVPEMGSPATTPGQQ